MEDLKTTESQPQVGSDAWLGRWWLLYLLLGLTAYNVIFDWLFNRLGTPTIAWEVGVVTTLTWVWLLKRPNDQAQRPPPETPGRLQQSRTNYLNRPTAQRGGGSLQRTG